MIVRTVMIAVTVTVTTVAAFGSIQNHGKILETLFAINIFQFGKHGAFQQAGTNHKEGTVCRFLDNLCICHNVYGRTVHKDIVIAGAELCKQSGKFSVFQQLCGIGRHGTYRNHLQIGIFIV